ncbi:hypothetical protein [Alteromonas gracilis]|uniref:hypothetical protein n=1 Tax=Alteromonas gracilis TaxID=1479524 RepID=UPI002FE21AB1
MTAIQLSFMILWILTLILSLNAIHHSKTVKPQNKIFMQVVVFLTPVFGGLLIMLMLIAEKDFFWLNSAYKDKTWIAEKDIERESNGDAE